MSVFWTTPPWLWPLLLVGAAGAVLYTWRAYAASRPPLRGLWRRGLPILRTVVFVGLVLAVAGPVISRLSTRTEPPELVILLEDSASMGLDAAGAPETGTSPTRWDRALAVAASVDSAVTRSNPEARIRLLRGNGLDPLREFNLSDPVIVDPTAHGTDLRALLDQAASRLISHPVRGLVLLSDGQETVRRMEGLDVERPVPAGAVPGSRPPVVVGMGDPVGVADRLIRDLRYPDTAYAGDEVVVEFAVSHLGGTPSAGDEVRLSLSRLGEAVGDTVITLDGRSQQVEWAFRPEGEGLQIYDLEVSPLDNERYRQNNRVSLAVDLRRSRSRILVLAARPGWDVRFLAQAASREARLEMQVAFRAERGWTLADSLTVFTPPARAADWAAWESVILCGWAGLDRWLDWAALTAAVEQGLGLLVLPAPGVEARGLSRSLPAPLADLLPVTFDQPDWRDGPVFASMADGGEGHPVLAGLSAAAAGRSMDAPRSDLAGLPPLQGVALTRGKAGALELLTARTQAGGDPRRLPLLVAGGEGSGQVVWFGGRRLWELSFWEPPSAGTTAANHLQPARQMLQNLLVWLSAGQEEAGLRFTGHRPVYQEGERIRLAATWRDIRGRTVQDRDLSVELQSMVASGVPQTFPLTTAPGHPGRFEVELPPLPPGAYQVRLMGDGDPPATGAVEDFMVTSYSVEQTQVRQDRRGLGQLASQLDGLLVQASDPGATLAITEAMDPASWTGRPLELRRRLDFRAGWPFLVGVVVLLGLEWFIRRQQGLL